VAEHLSDHDATVRVAAVRALGRLGGRAASLAVPRLLEDQIAFVRAAAATALGNVGRPADAARLIEMAMTDEFLPAQAAAAAAVRLSPTSVSAAVPAEGDAHLVEALDMDAAA
jgi:HEAT repeat protein